ncbi:uncharacterized protein [Drosophila kikkawai]|uniref:Uncharacterized protein n=1 Tax=Drosophila kikkawai TaxID=30033 RepID=A0A6P4IZK9_DROKI|nr:uncharacterized protein LOC108079017 [Drosophila kikkawai]
MTDRRSQRLQKKREAAAAVTASPGSVPTPQAGSDTSGSAGSITGAQPGSVTVASPESVTVASPKSVATYQLRSVVNPREATAPPSAGRSRAKGEFTNQRKKLKPVTRPTRPRGRPPGRIEKLPVFGPRRPRGRPPGSIEKLPVFGPRRPRGRPKILPPPPPKAAFKRTLEVMKSLVQLVIFVPLARKLFSTVKHYIV